MKKISLTLASLSFGLLLLTGCPQHTQPDGRVQYNYTDIPSLRSAMAKVGIALTIDPSIENSEYVQRQLQILIGNEYGDLGFNQLDKAEQDDVINALKDIKEVVITLSVSENISGDEKVLRLYDGYGSVVSGGETKLSGAVTDQKSPKGTSKIENGVLTLALTYSVDSSSVTNYKTTDAQIFKSINTDTDKAFIAALENGSVTVVSSTVGQQPRIQVDGYYSNLLTLLGLAAK